MIPEIVVALGILFFIVGTNEYARWQERKARRMEDALRSRSAMLAASGAIDGKRK